MASGNYLYADTSEERIAFAIEACNVFYYKTHPGQQLLGHLPPRSFYQDYIRAFVNYEKYNARLEELHAGAQEVLEVRQRNLVEQIHKINQEIARILNIKDEPT